VSPSSVRSRAVKSLVWAHPLAMIAVLALGLWVLREGVRIRASRLRGRAYDSRAHRRWARWLVALALTGGVAGLASAVALRGMEPLRSAHAWFVVPALCALALAGGLGLRLERRGSLAVRRTHLVAGAVGLLLALAGAFAGFAILP
jgi:hypothetical protein